MAKLAKTVFVADPEHLGATRRLDAGQEVPEHLQAAVTNEDAWEDGKLPTLKAESKPKSAPEPSPEGDEDTKPAAKKAANRPARGRKSAASEGDGS